MLQWLTFVDVALHSANSLKLLLVYILHFGIIDCKADDVKKGRMKGTKDTDLSDRFSAACSGVCTLQLCTQAGVTYSRKHRTYERALF
mmetsp:Transcript_16282/g.48820  ORF Transcript_16282/g.48820 Transcript_16282/m.48820 type:complete len:88 (+) Transcript_16282:1682-1945(+)